MGDLSTGQLSAGGRGFFPPTASLNMTEIVKIPVEMSFGLLARYAAGRVNPYTVMVCQQLCKAFHLTAAGRKYIDEAVSKLAVVGTLGATLQFGFGVKDLVRDMAQSEEGTLALALCAALRETYSMNMCTEILLEMARLTKLPGEYMPSNREWKSLLDVCSGVLTTTTFGLKVETLMRLSCPDQCLYEGEFDPQPLRKCSSPKSIAEALSLIAAVSTGDMQSIDLEGPSDAVWLATVAEVLLGLTIKVLDSKGETIHTNVTPSETAQIQILVATVRKQSRKGIIVRGRTYVLKEISEVLSKEVTSSIVTTITGRLEWKSVLGSTFPAEFKHMMRQPKTVGRLLGSAARIFKAIAQADAFVPERYLIACTIYCEEASGPGFIINTLSWFPELDRLRGHMEKAASNSLPAAMRDFERSLADLRQYCDCWLCNKRSPRANDPTAELTIAGDSTGDEEGFANRAGDLTDGEDTNENRTHGDDIAGDDTDGDDTDGDNTHGVWAVNKSDKSCAVIIAETIIVMSRILANVRLHSAKLTPMRSGIELVYEQQLQKDMQRQEDIRRQKDIHRNRKQQEPIDTRQIEWCKDFDAYFELHLVDGAYKKGIRLDRVLELFTGERPSISVEQTSAACTRGICAFLDVLQDLSLSEDAAAVIQVIPGRIVCEQKSYQSLDDRSVAEDKMFDETVLNLVESYADFPTLALSITESATALQCLFQLPSPLTSPLIVTAGPASLVALIAARRGLVRCPQSGRHVAQTCKRVSGLADAERERLQSDGGLITLDWTRARGSARFVHLVNHTSARLLLMHCAAQCAADFTMRNDTFIVSRECVDCCLRTAARDIFGSELYWFFRIATS